MIKKIINKLLSVKQSRTVFGYYDLINSFSSLSPKLISDLPPGKHAMVIAPHCDDESLGCGGTLHKHYRRGDVITAIFMTDGAMCDSDNREIARTRKAEAEQAAKILGINQCVFLDHPDRRLKTSDMVIRQIEDLLEKNNPDIVYLPFYLDNHPDHMETARICLTAIRRHPVKNVFMYELWTTMIPNCIVDISGSIDKKMEAVNVYHSQRDIHVFAEKIKSLNRYRSLGSDGHYQYAEGFFELNQEDLGKILDS